MESPHPTDLFHHRLAATWREDPVLLKAWCTAIAAAQETERLLTERGWSESERILAIHELCRALMLTAPTEV